MDLVGVGEAVSRGLGRRTLLERRGGLGCMSDSGEDFAEKDRVWNFPVRIEGEGGRGEKSEE